MRNFNPLRNEKGSLLVNAIAVTIIIAIISGVILQQSLTSIKTLRLPRIKAAMTSLEGGIRYLVLEASNYTGCDADAATGFSTCVFNGDLSKLIEIIPGCDDGSGNPCGVIVTAGTGYNAATRTYNAIISYQGNELSVKPKTVDIVVPVEILTQANVTCPPAGSPDDILFKGFTATGQKICAPIPNNTGCPAGEYMSGFDPATMTVSCQSITAASLGCAANEMLQTVSFTGSGFTRVCVPRPAPTTVPGWSIPP